MILPACGDIGESIEKPPAGPPKGTRQPDPIGNF
jgi:hypothetical protein